MEDSGIESDSKTSLPGGKLDFPRQTSPVLLLNTNCFKNSDQPSTSKDISPFASPSFLKSNQENKETYKWIFDQPTDNSSKKSLISLERLSIPKRPNFLPLKPAGVVVKRRDYPLVSWSDEEFRYIPKQHASRRKGQVQVKRETYDFKMVVQNEEDLDDEDEDLDLIPPKPLKDTWPCSHCKII